MKRICVDACLVVKWLTPEEDSPQACALLKRWFENETMLIAPGLLDYEVGSVLRKKIASGKLAAESLYPIFEKYESLGLELFHLTPLVVKCAATAALLKQNTIYDVSYLMLAKQQKVDFVTADEKFCRAALPLYSEIKFFRDLI